MTLVLTYNILLLLKKLKPEMCHSVSQYFYDFPIPEIQPQTHVFLVQRFKSLKRGHKFILILKINSEKLRFRNAVCMSDYRSV